jgi:Calcium binding
MNSTYDASWDLVKSKKGNLPANKEVFDKIYKEWQKRSWEPWLKENLTFPFIVERMEDEDDAYFTDIADHELFRLGHEMKVIGIDQEDDLYGIILKVREGRRVGHVPLCDVEVVDKKDPNFWPVREYVVWFANR